MYIYNNTLGLWSQTEGQFNTLCMQHKEKLGEYGSMMTRITHLKCLAKCVNEVDPTWEAGLNRLEPGLVSLLDGIYNVVDGSLLPIDTFDYLTEKFDFASPAPHESFINEREFLE